MQGPAETWLLAADNFEATLAQVGEDQWSGPTGCGDWTVRDLVDHAVFWQCNLASFLGAQVTPEDGWDTIKAAIVAGLENPRRLTARSRLARWRECRTPGDGAGHCRRVGARLDLARRWGRRHDARGCGRGGHMGLSQAPAELIRNPQVFGPIVEVPADASAQDKLIGFVGRQP